MCDWCVLCKKKTKKKQLIKCKKKQNKKKKQKKQLSNESVPSGPITDDNEKEDEEEEDTFQYDVILTDAYQYIGNDGIVWGMISEPFNTSDSLFDDTVVNAETMSIGD